MIQQEHDDSEPWRIAWRSVELEEEILAVLDSSPEPGERIEAAFRRKEHELAMVFARLHVHDAMELRRRLTLAPADDPIAARFARLIAERRVRLLAFLDGARRREALRVVR